jgi:hypothetical protein
MRINPPFIATAVGNSPLLWNGTINSQQDSCINRISLNTRRRKGNPSLKAPVRQQGRTLLRPYMPSTCYDLNNKPISARTDTNIFPGGGFSIILSFVFNDDILNEI